MATSKKSSKKVKTKTGKSVLLMNVKNERRRMRTLLAKAKETRVTRSFLLNLADQIHNGKQFLNLCAGTLQNGPDPLDNSRPMHCGLGELYFAMTGLQPNTTGVSEEDVVKLAIERTPIFAAAERSVAAARTAIAKMKLPQVIIDRLIKSLNVFDDSDSDRPFSFYYNDPVLMKMKAILGKIPKVNDQDLSSPQHLFGTSFGVCSTTTYKKRAKRVAAILRQAAALLPAGGA